MWWSSNFIESLMVSNADEFDSWSAWYNNPALNAFIDQGNISQR